MKTVLQLKNIFKQYKRFLLSDISFSVRSGSVCGLVGVNGAGKSTTIRILADLIQQDSGEVLLWGRDRKTCNQNARIGYVMDSSYFYEMQSIKQIAKRFSGLYSNWNWDRFDEFMRLFRLDEKQKAKDLSKGMKMQLALAVALSHGAELLVLDEPTSGLDPYIRDQLLTIIKGFASEQQGSVLFSTHITTDLEKAADQIIMLHEGKIVFDCPTEDLPSLQGKTLGTEWSGLDNCVLSYIEYLKNGGMK